MNRKLLCFDELIEQVVAVVGVMARGALFDQAACGISDQLGAQGAGCLRSGGARFRGISPKGRKFLKSEERQAMLREPGWIEQNETRCSRFDRCWLRYVLHSLQP